MPAHLPLWQPVGVPRHVLAQRYTLLSTRSTPPYDPVPDGLADAEQWIAHALVARDAGACYLFAIEHLERVVGSTSYYDYQPWRWYRGSPLQREDRPDAVDVGYTWLAASAQRTDCNTRRKPVTGRMNATDAAELRGTANTLTSFALPGSPPHHSLADFS